MVEWFILDVKRERKLESDSIVTVHYRLHVSCNSMQMEDYVSVMTVGDDCSKKPTYLHMECRQILSWQEFQKKRLTNTPQYLFKFRKNRLHHYSFRFPNTTSEFDLFRGLTLFSKTVTHRGLFLLFSISDNLKTKTKFPLEGVTFAAESF